MELFLFQTDECNQERFLEVQEEGLQVWVTHCQLEKINDLTLKTSATHTQMFDFESLKSKCVFVQSFSS